jgi:ribosome biogenesis GTPase
LETGAEKGRPTGSRAERAIVGRVFRRSTGAYDVEVDGRAIRCVLSSKLRKRLIYPTAAAASGRRQVVAVAGVGVVDPVAIGDEVRLVEEGAGTGMILEVLPRRNKLVRRAAGGRDLEQTIVANVDQVVPVFSVAEPAPVWGLLDRYLAASEARGIPSLISITKIDLAGADDVGEVLDDYRRIGYPVVETSTVTGDGVDALREALRGRVSVLAGKSGVGKTSLLNALEPGLGLRVGEVSESTGKGRHTTTRLEMFPLAVGGSVVDTPGVREFGLWEVDLENLDSLFPEMRPLLGQCRFGMSCVHDQEPGCAVKAAVEDGRISPRRYESYLRLREE